MEIREVLGLWVGASLLFVVANILVWAIDPTPATLRFCLQLAGLGILLVGVIAWLAWAYVWVEEWLAWRRYNRNHGQDE